MNLPTESNHEPTPDGLLSYITTIIIGLTNEISNLDETSPPKRLWQLQGELHKWSGWGEWVAFKLFVEKAHDQEGKAAVTIKENEYHDKG